MHMLFVIEDLSTGGAQRQMINIALAMQKRGHVVEFFYYRPFDFVIDQLKAAGIPVHFDQKKSRYSLNVFFTLRKLIQTGKFDLVLSFLSTPNFYNIVTTRLLPNRPAVVVSERQSDPDGSIDWRLAMTRQTYRMADHVTTNSHYQRVQLTEQLPWLAKRISTIYNGYNLEKFHPSDQWPADDVLKILVIGRVVPNKNGLCLIKALEILRDEHHLRPQVDWVGEHFEGHGEELSREIAARHLENQWNWLYQRQDIVDLFHQHHVLVHPSYNEGLPNVVCEALACGRPVILSNLQDNPYLVQDGVSGYLFDWQDPRDLAQKILAYSQLSPEKRVEMGQHGRAFAEANLSQTRLADEYENLFKRLKHA
jgi:glycosyltransferase involved in cell wall biosynthesis